MLCLHELGQFLTPLSTETGASGENMLPNGKVMDTIQMKYPRGINVTSFRHACTIVRSS